MDFLLFVILQVATKAEFNENSLIIIFIEVPIFSEVNKTPKI